jgi:hypothetical protein
MSDLECMSVEVENKLHNFFYGNKTKVLSCFSHLFMN